MIIIFLIIKITKKRLLKEFLKTDEDLSRLCSWTQVRSFRLHNCHRTFSNPRTSLWIVECFRLCELRPNSTWLARSSTRLFDCGLATCNWWYLFSKFDSARVVVLITAVRLAWSLACSLQSTWICQSFEQLFLNIILVQFWLFQNKFFKINFYFDFQASICKSAKLTNC